MMNLIPYQSSEILGYKTLNCFVISNRHCRRVRKRVSFLLNFLAVCPVKLGASLTCRAGWGPSRCTGNLAGSAPPRRHRRAPLHTPRSLRRNRNISLTAAALWTTVFSPPANHPQGLKNTCAQRTAQHFILQNTARTLLLTHFEEKT